MNKHSPVDMAAPAVGGASHTFASVPAGEVLDLRRVLDNMSDGFLLIDADWRILYLNRRGEELIASFKPASEVVGRTIWDSFPGLLGTPAETMYRRAMGGEETADLELYYAPLTKWFQVRAYPADGRLVISFQDISRRKNAEALLGAERDVLSLLAKGADLSDVLERIAAETESRSTDGMLCSILLLDESGEHLLHGAAPSLPEAYNQAIHGLRIGPGVGSCGTAAYERKSVFVTDIASHPYWAPFSALAREHRLGACCSTPIFGSDGNVRGTIAMYYRRAHEPSAQDRQLIELAAQLAALAIQRHQSDVAVRRSEEQFRALADSIAQLAWMAEPDGAVTWYNRRWLDYTGVPPEELHGWGWQSVHDPAYVESVVERWKQAIAAGEPFEMEFPLRGADGRFRWFLSRAIPVRNERGEVTRWFGTNTDVDHERLLRQTLEDERGVLELLNETGGKLASKLEIHALLQEITDAGTRLSGAEFGAFFYNSVDERGDAYMLYTLSGAPREAFEKFGQPRATALFGATFRGEGVIRLDDVRADPRYGQNAPHFGMPRGHLPVCSYLAVPVQARAGEVLGGLFFGHPEPGRFSERAERLIVGIASQAAIALDNARLYDAAQKAAREKAELLEREQRARADAERMSSLKDDFLATLSHELRTPLSAILGWSQILRRGGADPQKLMQAVDTIERNARSQAQLIEDLLDMSRITAGKLRLDIQPVEPFNVVSAAIETVLPAANVKGIRIERLLDPGAGPVSGDPQRLQQVVWNLLSNAIKFTPKGGKVQVVLQRVNSHIEISVADTGAGIKAEFLPHVFERFRQADASTTRAYGGLGLGLSIVKNLVELHGGVVRARSGGEGCGSTFTVELPLIVVAPPAPLQRVHPTAPTARAPEFQPVDLSDITVLVVDDEEDGRDLVRHVLVECKATVLAAASGVEALRLVRERRPDVLVSDIGMPEMDGYALLAAVRALGPANGGAVPAVALTAFARSEDRTRALRAGFLVHVAKPVEAAELVATVAAVVGRTGPAG